MATPFTTDAGSKAIDQREHNEDASAKKVVQQWLNSATGEWSNVVPDLVSGMDYDNITVTNTSATSDEVVFNLSSNPVKTMNITYVDSSVDKVSDELVSVDFT